MRIQLTGMSGTGKSALARELYLLLSMPHVKDELSLPIQSNSKTIDYRIIAIDNMRRHYNLLATLEGEMFAYDKFIKYAKNNQFSIVECSGYSVRYPYLLTKKYLQTTLVVELHSSRDKKECFRIRQERLQYRDSIEKHQPIPFPYVLVDGGLEKYDNVCEFIQAKEWGTGGTLAIRYDHEVMHLYNTEDTNLTDLAGVVVKRLIERRQSFIRQVGECRLSCSVVVPAIGCDKAVPDDNDNCSSISNVAYLLNREGKRFGKKGEVGCKKTFCMCWGSS